MKVKIVNTNNMKTALTFIVLATLSIKGYSQNIVFDNTFANNGVLVVPTNELSQNEFFDVDPNGNIFTASIKKKSLYNYKIVIAKADKNGVLDSEFGVDGESTIALGETDRVFAFKVLSNSKILIGGQTSYGSGLIGYLLRLNTNGTIDSSFANNGVYEFTQPGTINSSINILSDNSIVLSAYSYYFIYDEGYIYQSVLVKLNENGAPDLQYGINGQMELTSSAFNFCVWQSIATDNDDIISVGFDNTDQKNFKIAYCRTDAHGNFVTTFGTDGKVIMDLQNEQPGDTEHLAEIKKGADNKYYSGGYGRPEFLIRFNDNGSLDTTFADNGILTYKYRYHVIDLQDDGKILIAGDKSTSDLGTYAFSIMRFNQNGSPDSTFYNGATYETDLLNKQYHASDIKFISPNSLLLAGSIKENVAKTVLMKLRLDNLTGTPEIANQSNFSVYPNPFVNQVNLGSIRDIKTVEVYDITGKQINIQFADHKLLVFNDITKGIYCLKIVLKNGKQITKKLIKM